MKPIYSLLFLLTFLSQNAFCQDYSKMSANEKAKVIIYGNDYPYSLLLESGSDTLSYISLLEGELLIFLFENGKMIEFSSEKYTKKYYYDGMKIIESQTIVHYSQDTTYFYTKYEKDTLVSFTPYPKRLTKNSSLFPVDSVIYIENAILWKGFKWIFEKDRIVTEFRPPMRTSFYFDNQQKIFFVKDGYVNFLTENFFTEEQLESEFSEGDFITEEKNELKIKILKSPKGKPINLWKKEGY